MHEDYTFKRHILSEITFIQDDEVLSYALTGERNISLYSNYQWPKQKHPDTKT